MPSSGLGCALELELCLFLGHECVHSTCKSSLMKFSYLGRMAISRVDFWSFITELVTRNPTMGIPTLEDGLFVNLLIFDYFDVQVRLRCV